MCIQYGQKIKAGVRHQRMPTTFSLQHRLLIGLVFWKNNGIRANISKKSGSDVSFQLHKMRVWNCTKNFLVVLLQGFGLCYFLNQYWKNPSENLAIINLNTRVAIQTLELTRPESNITLLKVRIQYPSVGKQPSFERTTDFKFTQCFFLMFPQSQRRNIQSHWPHNFNV